MKHTFSHYFSSSLLLLFLTIFSINTSAQQLGTISGTITDEAGNALVGANVFVYGTMRGASADINGKYSFHIEPGTYSLRVSFIGYETDKKGVTVKAGETLNVNFTLKESLLSVGDEVLVIGSRSARTATESTVPVDIITFDEIRRSGETELDQLLKTVAPSFNANPQTISDGTDHINPASLRGLGPDQVLVLINGKRYHHSALLNVNGTFGRGTVGTDLNSIPTSAIKRIEILRDGAAAQYGSDAIAGVINIVLNDQVNKLSASTQVGQTGEGDGQQVKAGVNYGFNIGDMGYFNITGEYLQRDRTNRSDPWLGDIFPGISGTAATDAELKNRGLTREDFSMKTGQGAATVAMVYFNSAVPLSEDAKFYSFGGITYRKGSATGFFRLPNSEARVVPELYPNGFLPEINPDINDRNFTAGLRGVLKGWDVDLSLTYGGNDFHWFIENTNNASMGAASPTSFDAGILSFNQTTGNIDFVKFIKTNGAVEMLSVNFGGAFRIDNYKITAGEDGSWMLGNGGSIPGVDFDTTSTGAPKAAGSQVFPGFQPSNAVDRLRNSLSIYAGMESQLTQRLQLDLAARFENYSDFGSTFIGKAASRFKVTENISLRGAYSTGFRAPSLNQIWFSNVSTQFVFNDAGDLVPKQVMTANNRSAVAKAFGIPDLKEETSSNISIGFTAKPMRNFSITADYYMISIKDRIVLTSRFSNSDPIVAGILKPFEDQGVGAAQFFANAVDTKTAGFDLVTNYNMRFKSFKLEFTLAGNYSKTTVDAIHIPQSVANKFAGGDLDAVKTTFFNREEQNRLEDALPQTKGTFSVKYTTGRLAVTTRANYYGEVYYKPTNPANDETFSAKTLFDLDVTYELFDGLLFSIGGNNILNTFPDKHQKLANYSNGRFPYSRRVTQFGINGGFYYTRLSLNL